MKLINSAVSVGHLLSKVSDNESLYGIDASETPKTDQRTCHVNKPGQFYGKESWKALEGKIMGKQVRLDIIDIDQYKRMVGTIWIGNRNINLEMVQEGYAEAYVEHLREPYRGQFLQAQGKIDPTP